MTYSRSGNRRYGQSSSRRRPHGGNRRRSTKKKQPSFNPAQFINKNPAKLEPVQYEPKHTFETFGLRPELVAAIHACNITIPSAIQDQVIPEALAGKDVIGLAETGTGKTAAFLVPIIESTLANHQNKTLILAPTRELALQINKELRKFTPYMKLYSTVCVGGTSIRPQIERLKRSNHFIIGTPGRVLDLMNRGVLTLDTISHVVLDEADRMLDMGFIHDMRQILSATPDTRQTLFMSATMTPAAEKLAAEFLKNPAMISVKKRDVTTAIEQDIVPHDHEEKFDKLTELLSNHNDFSRVIVFGAMKHSVERLSQNLRQSNIEAVSIHGNKTHPQRQSALRRFQEGQARVLVATDVAARGIHVDDVSHVINYDLPNTFEDYVHRIGRTGRGRKTGKALTFVPKSRANA